MQKPVWIVLIWLGVIALIAFPIVYSVHHWSIASFRDGAIGNWLGTALGLTAGLPLGLALERLRERASKKANRHSLGHLIYRELEFNLGLVTSLDSALAEFDPLQLARPEFWKWAETIVDGFELETYRELGAMLRPEERVYYVQVANTYDSLRRLSSTVRQSASKSALLLASGNQGEANNLVVSAKTGSGQAVSQIKDALKELGKAPA